MAGLHIVDAVQTDSISNKAGTGAPTFPFGVSTRGSANLPAQATAWTLTADSPEDLYISSPAAPITQALPTTNVKAGKRFRLTVAGATETNYVALQSSGANEIDRIGGTGYILVQALQDAPTTAAHWKVMQLEENSNTIAAVTTGDIGVNSNTIVFRKKQFSSDGICWMEFASATAASGGTSSIGIPASTLPARFRPASAKRVVGILLSNNIVVAAAITVSTDGSVTYKKYDGSNFSGTTGLSDGTTTYHSTSPWIVY